MGFYEHTTGILILSYQNLFSITILHSTSLALISYLHT